MPQVNPGSLYRRGERTCFERAAACGLRQEERGPTSAQDDVLSQAVGGLLSAHLLASDPTLGIMAEYDGCLLGLAEDLARRLMPAFSTRTGPSTCQYRLYEY